jgi:uncharacterized membrane protein
LRTVYDRQARSSIDYLVDGNGRAVRLQSHCALWTLSDGLWSPSRGLARNTDGYYARLINADAPPARRPISIAHRSVASLLLPIPIVCFIGGLITDLTYRASGGNMLWLDFSSWLIAAGLLFGAIAGLLLLIDAARGAASWIGVALLLAAWVDEFINSLVHARDGWTAVVPLGLTLSVIAVVLVLIGGWLAHPAYHRHEGAVA